MSDALAAELIAAAEQAKFHAFDTAPSYGVAETRLGQYLGNRGCVWSKVSPTDFSTPPREFTGNMLERLARSSIDLLQWHNWTPDVGSTKEFVSRWKEFGADPRIKALGATTYGATDAKAAIRSGLFSVVQVEWNLLNQDVLLAVGSAAKKANVKLAVRSVYLQGLLSEQGRDLPDPNLCDPLLKARMLAANLKLPLNHLALRAALDEPSVDYVLVGCDRVAQVYDAARVASMPVFEDHTRRSIAALNIGASAATDPRAWR